MATENPQESRLTKKLWDNLESDPIKLADVLFNSKLWAKQVEIIQSVWQNKRTAVKSCNSGGKSHVSALITLLYLLCFRPSRVITTAPTFLQVSDILWKEIASLYHRAKFPIGGTLNKTSLEFGSYDGSTWDAIGISTNEVNRFQGFKSPHLLVIIDEALGVSPEIWEAMEGLQPHRILVIGNPLEATGNFYDCFNSPLWNKITINGEECVKWQKQFGRLPGLITEEWIKERSDDWGRKSPLFVARILGEFPEETGDTLILRGWVDRARKGLNAEGIPLDDEQEEDSVKILSTDVATKHGSNYTVITYRYGHTFKEMKAYSFLPLTKTRDKLLYKYHEKTGYETRPSLVLDSDGVGEGLDDMLDEEHIPHFAFRGGYAQKADDSARYRNLRTQFYCMVAKKFEKGLYNLKHLDEKSYEVLKSQLCSIKVKSPDAMGRIQIETKEDMMARGIESPDHADSFMMSEYGFYMNRYVDVRPIAYR